MFKKFVQKNLRAFFVSWKRAPHQLGFVSYDAVMLLTGPRLAILIVTNWATLIVTNWATLIVTNWATSFSHYKNRGFR